ncbi:MAG: hydroxyacid dehydrogenase [Deltaproteobacteria bacterium]|nr:hydroxyacid dehydrogenase [Deltaproteobacteria bacterium]MBW2152217.1 hydroxyacid dehydrogenase [Deltaproteobacteria bacterium]
MLPKALYYRILKYQHQNLALLKRYFDLIELDNPNENNEDILAGIEVLFAPLGYNVNAEYMDRCPKLRAIVSNTTGIPHIDAEEARRRGVVVCALHDEQTFLETITSTAEHTIGLILAASRKLPAAHAAACKGCWDRKLWGAPRMMSRMRLGLVGYGRLGRKVANIARAMGMEIDYYDPYVPGGVSTLIDLARRSDVLSLHAVANEETKKIVNRTVLEALPRGAIVINTARGELLETEALLDLLESGHLWAAALDTVEGEYSPDFSKTFIKSRIVHYARTHDNLILTPHIGGSTIDAWTATEQRVIIKTCRVFGISIDQNVM